MPGRLGPRFAVEAGFLVLLAVGMGLANLSPGVIVLVMAIAWLLVAAIEWTASRKGPVFPARLQRRSFVSAATPAEESLVESDRPAAAETTPAPVEQEKAGPRGRLFWQREKTSKSAEEAGSASAGPARESADSSAVEKGG